MNAFSISDFRSKTMLALAAFLTVLALPGCGSDSTASKVGANSPAASAPTQAVGATTQPDAFGATGPAPTGRNPCEYMVRADAEAAVGQPLPKTSEHIPLGMCDYTTAEFDGASLTVGDWESIKGAATSGNAQPVAIAGVGDEALNLNGSNGSTLYVRKGNQGFLLTLNGQNIDGLPDHGLEREKILALKILPNF